jgi:hypothetical protein
MVRWLGDRMVDLVLVLDVRSHLEFTPDWPASGHVIRVWSLPTQFSRGTFQRNSIRVRTVWHINLEASQLTWGGVQFRSYPMDR